MRVVEPLMEPDPACTIVVPALAPVASPALLMVATVLLDVQVAELVRFC